MSGLIYFHLGLGKPSSVQFNWLPNFLVWVFRRRNSGDWDFILSLVPVGMEIGIERGRVSLSLKSVVSGLLFPGVPLLLDTGRSGDDNMGKIFTIVGRRRVICNHRQEMRKGMKEKSFSGWGRPWLCWKWVVRNFEKRNVFLFSLEEGRRRRASPSHLPSTTGEILGRRASSGRAGTRKRKNKRMGTMEMESLFSSSSTSLLLSSSIGRDSSPPPHRRNRNKEHCLAFLQLRNYSCLF